MNELRCSDCWKLYKDKISFSAFQKIWEGTTWQSVMPEVYTKENILFHTNQKGNGGEKIQSLNIQIKKLWKLDCIMLTIL